MDLLRILQQEMSVGLISRDTSPSGNHHIIVTDNLCLFINVFGVTVLFENWLFFEGELRVTNFHWIENDNLVVFDIHYIVHDEWQKCVCHFSHNDFFAYCTPVRKRNLLKNKINPCRIKKTIKDVVYTAVRYYATGVFGYLIRDGETDICSINSSVMLNPDICIRGFEKNYVHKHYDGQITLAPGVRRTVADEFGNVQGYYEYVSLNEFWIIAGNSMVSVKVSENDWTVYSEGRQVAEIRRLPEKERTRFAENGYDMEKYFLINISSETDFVFYPYIMAIPVLGF